MADESTPSGESDRPRRGIESPRRSAWRWIMEFVVYLVIAIVVVSLVRLFLVQPFLVPTGSMEETLQDQDTIVA